MISTASVWRGPARTRLSGGDAPERGVHLPRGAQRGRARRPELPADGASPRSLPRNINFPPLALPGTPRYSEMAVFSY